MLSIEGMKFDKGNLWRYENKDAKPSHDFYCAVSKVFHVNLNWLISDVGEMYTVKNKHKKVS
jgi:transcriptional regulator with XRE-family HTH domain